MTYEQTLEYLFKQLPMYQREGKSAYKKDLTNTLRLCEILGNPEKQFKSIHVAGTNGKGSTAHMLAATFQQAGYKTGLYTSPHLKDFRERIRINGEVIPKQTVVDFLLQHQTKFEHIQPSFFEWTVALAFDYFASEKVDIAIIETGLGGRLDSTNVIHPELSIITNISMDHTDLLGETLAEIAGEKAGIIKENVPVVIGKHSGQKALFMEAAMDKNALIYFAESLKSNVHLSSDLIGNYQQNNLKTVFQSWLILRKLGWKISFTHLENALNQVVQTTGLRGRWETLSTKPLLIADTAHNEVGLIYAMQQLQEQETNQIHLVLGFVKDKNLAKLLPLFPKKGHYYFCQANVPRAESAEIICDLAAKLRLKGEVYGSVVAALDAAKTAANEKDIIYVGGSNFVVSEVL